VLPAGQREGERASGVRGNGDRFEALYESIPLMCFTLGDEGVVRSVNSYGANELGYEPAELVGESLLGVVHPEDHDAVKRQLRESLEDPGRVAGWEFRKIRRDGSVLWVSESIRNVKAPDGRREVLAICKDLREWKLHEQTIRERAQRPRALMPAPSLTQERHRQARALDPSDCIGATLANAVEKLQELEQNGTGAWLKRRLAEVTELVSAAIQSTRSLTFDLRSRPHDRPGPEAPLQDSGLESLTNREQEVLRLIATGLTNKEIAARIHVSVKTVSTHRQNTMDKLNIHNAVGLTRYAIRNGLMSAESPEH
jgi:PAS domain S-box-containing protein